MSRAIRDTPPEMAFIFEVLRTTRASKDARKRKRAVVTALSFTQAFN
jgi:hypothetical protein